LNPGPFNPLVCDFAARQMGDFAHVSLAAGVAAQHNDLGLLTPVRQYCNSYAARIVEVYGRGHIGAPFATL
jgi:hypothetical protein